MNNYIFLADAFGYGPITTSCLIAKKLKEKSKNKFIFIGPSYCIEKAKKENVFDEYIECTYEQKEIEKYIEYFIKAKKIIATETTDILIYLINNYNLKNIYLIDNLFWMWDFLEDELRKIKKYYISNIIDVRENIERIASDYTNLKVVGSLREMTSFKRCGNNKNLIISLGGAEAYLIDPNIIQKFYYRVINIILANENIKNFDNIYITGGKGIIEYLKKRINGKNIIINSYDNDTYLKILQSCSHAIMAPGLGNFNEIISTDIIVMFLLPINYSQYLQRLAYKDYDANLYFQENREEDVVEKFLSEDIGVDEVIANLKKYNYDFKELDDFLIDTNYRSKERKKIYDSIPKNGIEEVCNDIERS